MVEKKDENTPFVVLKQASYSYKTSTESISIVENLDFSIKPKEKVIVFGPSGVGKTTFLSLLGMLSPLSLGSFFFQEENVTHVSEDKKAFFRRQYIGFIYQSPFLLQDFTALENVAMGLIVQGVKKKEALERAKDLMIKLDLEDRCDFLPSQLSGGQQQRVSVGRALIKEPRLLLADEPTGNLDSERTEQLCQQIFSLCEEKKTALVFVTHNESLSHFFDRRLRFENKALKDF